MQSSIVVVVLRFESQLPAPALEVTAMLVHVNMFIVGPSLDVAQFAVTPSAFGFSCETIRHFLYLLSFGKGNCMAAFRIEDVPHEPDSFL
jgi:hypothetical protein